MNIEKTDDAGAVPPERTETVDALAVLRGEGNLDSEMETRIQRNADILQARLWEKHP